MKEHESLKRTNVVTTVLLVCPHINDSSYTHFKV